MIKRNIKLGIGVILLLFFGCKQPDKKVITIAAAANMQFAIEEIADAFTKQSGISCEFVISSSGKLTAQIKEGAPYDIFVSADMRYPEDIYASGLSIEAPKTYAYGQLVLWSISNEIEPSLKMLTDEKITHIAMANPKIAPYGKAAIEVLKNYGVYEKTKHKLVYGESIAQTNQFITSKASEIGFTAKSVVLSSKMRARGKWTLIDNNTYTPIKQGIVTIKRENQNKKNVQQFYDFLFSSKGKKILEEFGYLVAE